MRFKRPIKGPMSQLRVFATGIRDNEIITSAPGAKQNSGSLIQVKGFYPPSKAGVAALDEVAIRDQFNHLPFFKDLSPQQRLAWLNANAIDNRDLYMEDVDLKLKFIKIGGSFFTTALSQDQLDTLQRGNPDDPDGFWPISVVYNMFPRKPGSKARKHTLIFRPSNWVLQPEQPAPTTFTGMYVDLDTLELKNGEVKKPAGGYLRVFKTEKMVELLPGYAVVINQVRQTPLTWEYLLELIKRFAGEGYVTEMKKVRPLIEWFTPSLHKSLIQKLIRTRCEFVEYGGTNYPASAVLLTTLSMLMLHAGAFVPNIQRFVSGLESAAKRLAVSVAEDSFIDDPRYIMGLFASAAVAQADRTWSPTDGMIELWFRIGLAAQQDIRIFDYDWHTFNGIREWNPATFSYFLLGEVRSFESDIKMVGSIAERGFKAREYKAPADFPLKIMPLIHCVDHHSLTTIAHYMPYSGKLYSEVFTDIWNNMVGVNPRLEKYSRWSPDTKETKDIREAQKLLWINQIYTPQPRTPAVGEDKGVREFKYKLDISWIAGLIGPIEVRVGSVTCIVVLRVDDIYKMTAIKRPSRDSKAPPELTEEEKEAALNKARNMLETGIVLTKVPSTIPEFKGATVYLRGSPDSMELPPTYYLRLANGSVGKWEDLIYLTYNFPIYPDITPSIENALLYTGDGINKSADSVFDYVINGTSGDILRRMATYLEASRTKIDLYKISRDGSGVDQAVQPEDTAVNQILCYICCLYPAALVKTTTGFNVKNGPLMWTLREKLILSIRSKMVRSEARSQWAIVPPNDRKLWEHQRDSVEMMIDEHEKGKRGHGLYLPVGTGKTGIVLSYIIYLIGKGEMPDYCVYTLPPSARDSIERELQAYRIPYQVLDMRVEGRIKAIVPGMVNICLHDHLRLNGLDEQIRTIAPKMLFINDEFHKTLASKTIRTSLALSFAALSQDFVIMSGTLVRDSSVDPLIQWLELLVEFEVTEHNYWTAVSGLISKKVVTHVVVERVVIDAKILDEAKYYSMVPRTLGGTSTSLNFKGAYDESNIAVDAELVRQALAYIELKEPIFIVTRNSAHQKDIEQKLTSHGVRNIYLITKDTPITLLPDDPRPIQAVVTTIKHVEGYSLVKMRVMLFPVILSNEASREQAVGRLNRLNQPSPVIRVITIHSGILSYIFKRYEKARSLSEALKSFASDIGLEDASQLRGLL